MKTAEKLMEIENAVTELEKVGVILSLVVNQAESSPKVEDLQIAFFVFEEMFKSKFASLKVALYGGDKNA